MNYNATVKRGSILFPDNPKINRIILLATNVRVYAKIILNDIEVTEVYYNGAWYTTDTINVIFD